MFEFQTATNENSAAIYGKRETSNLLAVALYLTRPENKASVKTVLPSIV